MNEDNGPVTPEHNIGLTRQVSPVQAVSEARRAKQLANGQLRCRILGLHVGHDGTALQSIEKIGHGYNQNSAVLSCFHLRCNHAADALGPSS